MKMTRVVLADDHAVVRTYIRKMLEKSGGIQVVGEARNGVEALQAVDKLAPDVLLLDMEMPVMGGVEVARTLKASRSKVRVLVLSAYDDQQYIKEMLSNGAAGYLTKDEAPDIIVEAVQRVANGQTGLFSRRLSTLPKEHRARLT